MSWKSIDESPSFAAAPSKASSLLAEIVLGAVLIAGVAGFYRSRPASAPAAEVPEPAPEAPPASVVRTVPEETAIPEAVAPPPPPPPPPAPAPPEPEPAPLLAVPVAVVPRLEIPPLPVRSPEAAAYDREWRAAAARAAQRDLDGAAAIVKRAGRGPEEVRREAGQDAADLERLRAFEARAVAKLAGAKRGAWIELELRGGALVSGELGAASPERLELRRGEGAVFVEMADLAWSTLARHGDEDLRALGLAWLLDGRPDDAWEATGRRADAFEPKHWHLPRPEAPAEPAPAEFEARRLLHEAERLFRAPATRAAAVAKYRILLSEFPETPVVRRSLSRIGARARAPEEIYFGTADLRGAGSFKPGKDGWKTEGSVEFHKARHSFVEAEFEAEPGTAYRAFVRIGGCCAETLTAYGQASGLEKPHPTRNVKVAVEPGSIYAVILRRPELDLPKTHAAGHVLRWGWTELPLPAYATAGPKRIRVLTEREGMGVSGILITTSRAGPPSDAELPALEASSRVE